MTAGVVVGRFQCAAPHEGHRYILEHAQQNHDLLVIVVGVAPTLSRFNPLSYHAREMALRAFYPTALILPLEDRRDDAEWNQALDALLYHTLPGVPCILYGGRDSCCATYKGFLQINWVETMPKVAARDLRAKQVEHNSIPFREGVIFAANRMICPVVMMVDIILRREMAGGERLVLAIKKPGEADWRFPGGRVEDGSLEQAAKRELMEETGLTVEGALRYLKSGYVHDWRYKPHLQGQHVLTAVFEADYSSGSFRAGSDAVAVAWVDYRDKFVPEHDWIRALAFETKKESVNEPAVTD